MPVYQPVPELSAASLAVTRRSFYLIVYLPCSDSGIVGVALCKHIGNALCIVKEHGSIDAPVRPYACLYAPAVRADADDIRIGLVHPQRRTAGRYAQHYTYRMT